MNSLKIYCVTNKRLIQLEKTPLNFAGVGNDKFTDKYIIPNKLDNIYYKEKHVASRHRHRWSY